MAWTTTPVVEDFLAVTGDLLRSRPVEHNLILTVTDRLLVAGPHAFGPDTPVLGWWSPADPPGDAPPDGASSGGGRADGAAPGGAFIWTPPHPPHVTAVSDAAAAALADVFAGIPDHLPVPGIGADPRTAESFAARWCALTGAVATVHMRMRLYELGTVVPPDPAPAGRSRTAGAADRELLCEWFQAFADVTGSAVGDVAAQVDERLGYNGITLWEDAGRPVAMAARTRVVSGLTRIGLVYTPQPLRGRGYGSAATAAASREARLAGASRVVLYTDLANPTSNAIYQRIGYRPVRDRLVLSFAAS